MKEFIDCIKNKYACFSGRARRREYWMFLLFLFIFSFVASIVDIVLGMSVISLLLALGTLLPHLGVTIRRLHDSGRSGWWCLLAFVPFFGILLIVFLCLDSQPGENQYGPNPKAIS